MFARDRLAAGLVGTAILGLRATIRIEERHAERHRELRARGVPFAFALWHGRMVLPILVHRHEGVVTMASRSKDGEIIALWLARNGYVAARGSTTRGGGTALMEMLVEMRTGRPGALTVDGPKGPPRVVQPGILRLVRETGAWILPISGASSRPRFLRSWDRFLVPCRFPQRGHLRRAVRSARLDDRRGGEPPPRGGPRRRDARGRRGGRRRAAASLGVFLR